MLGIENKLHFPKIRYSETSSTGDGKPSIATYKLDWTRQEKLVKDDHEYWNKNSWPNLDIPFVGSLPEPYDSMVKSLRFGLRKSYLLEINRCSRAALNELNIKRSMDTNIRDFCLKPAESFVEIAFKLLADSIYDTETMYYTRDYEKKVIAFHSMLYKFWCYQTGRGLILSRSGVHDLVSRYTVTKQKDEDVVKVQGFLKALKSHNKRLHESYDQISVECQKEISEKE